MLRLVAEVIAALDEIRAEVTAERACLPACLPLLLRAWPGAEYQ